MLETDACTYSWGASLLGPNVSAKRLSARGIFTGALRHSHITLKELTAVMMALLSFKHMLTNKTVRFVLRAATTWP